jgi:membrane associated rhomboid family serine protease
VGNVARTWYQRRVSTDIPVRPGGRGTAATDDRLRFGTDAFYGAIGRAFLVMCAFIPLLWLIELLNWAMGGALDRDGGIWSRDPAGLDGIVFAPFLHASFTHVAANSVPLLLLGTFVLAGQVKRFLLITGFIAVISGLSVWLFGPTNTVTVGASGVIFGYLGYLLLRGIVERRWWSIGVSLLVGLLYGWQLTGVLPGDPHISWQAHLGGFIGGLVAAILFRRKRPRKPTTPKGTTTADPTLTLPGSTSTLTDATLTSPTITLPGNTTTA